MNSEINKKTPAFIYGKEFKLSKVLGNLQAYKLATGDVGQAEREEVSRKHGNNLGALYGDLITKASLESGKIKRKQEDEVDIFKKRKRRKKRNRQNGEEKKDGPHYPVPTVVNETLEEALPLPEWLKQDEDNNPSLSKEESSDSDNKESETMDFFGLSTGQNGQSSPEESDDATMRNVSKGSPNVEGTTKTSENVLDPTAIALTTYSCSRCNRRGHLTEHCTIPQAERKKYHHLHVENTSHRSADIQDLFLQCRKLKRLKNVSCIDCGSTSNLAFCFECRVTLCDGRGHLIEHLLKFPTHKRLYSHKLQKVLKCSNSSCSIVDVDKLLVCPQCLSKVFDKQYSLVNATWSNRGLRSITNILCCEEHFHWHRMNCYESSGERLFKSENLLKLQQENSGLMSEFFF
ncbi:uncharacterized protein LOC114519785 [Dendronephthya gigantea]|uniref:uncharacterized protein LOC114519785 n=1 Tax=Dendronephthya gigantea TaxID=151771 RepID=UPI00106C3BC6|nr:uncharacterized protein LOC114519785 [Dendronephthya gigantea]